jgi:hypothetical protein
MKLQVDDMVTVAEFACWSPIAQPPPPVLETPYT